MKRWKFIPALLLAALSAHTAEPAQVLPVGTYHFSNPGADLGNVDAVDVTCLDRQAELQAITDSLARFDPDYVGVEWPAGDADSRYAQYLAGTLAPSRNEVVQLGFRLAAQRKLDRVHGLDVPGDVPFEAVQAWAKANGREAELSALIGQAVASSSRITQQQQDSSIGQVLRSMNEPDEILPGQGFYTELLRFDQGDERPGVALNAAWGERNLAICARLLQSLPPGGRAVVFYGAGHAYLLRRCIAEAPGVRLVEANDYLPDTPRAGR